MTKKHFIDLAALISRSADPYSLNQINELAGFCGRHSANFQRDKFKESCGRRDKSPSASGPLVPVLATLTAQQRFFYDNAVSSYTPAVETQEQGRIRGAVALAAAETWAAESGLIFIWQPDYDDWGDGDNTPEVRESCHVENENGHVLASLCGICDADNAYRRVVQAELASEVMPEGGAQ